MKLIVGLGNPGEKYARTRHNFGFMVLDRLAYSFGATFCEQSKFKAATAEIHSDGEKVVLVKPLTFMNLSGDSVAALAYFYKVESKDIWVVADDLDLPLGKIRVRSGGESGGGHNGLKDIIAKLGNGDFWRIRLGIRGDATRQEHLNNQIATHDFVLSVFTNEEQKLLESVIQQAVIILGRGIEEKSLTAHSHNID